ncbi:hypothetical protein ABZY05_50385 [Streptomyces canus]|uniref:hypothetical protein n=1 Tax=Streptomyces canus TaxID=58343 RepID=UPI0033ADF922
MLLAAAHRRAVRIAAVVLILAVALTAWVVHGRSSPATRPTTTGSADVDADALNRRLPFQRLLYLPSAAILRVQRAEQRLTVACMRRHGFTFKPATSAASDEHPTPFGLESLAPQPPAASVPPERSRGEAFTRALYGDPDKRISAKGTMFKISRPADGCQAEAEKQLLGNSRLRWLQLRIRLGEGEKEARDLLEKDGDYRALQARWGRCMRQTGFQQKDPLSVLLSLPRGTQPAANAAARADMRCKDATHYLPTAYNRLRVVQQDWLDDHSATLAEWNRLQTHQDALARKVLA